VPSEKEFQAMVVELGRALAFTSIYHTFDSRRSAFGFPDLVLVSPARRRIVYLELKGERGKLTLEQAVWLRELSAAGAEAHAVWPRDWDAVARGLSSGDWGELQGPPLGRKKPPQGVAPAGVSAAGAHPARSV
jgi:hypothetical protein